MGGICAIHQPNFFPWLGYFDKIRRADVFVFLDAVDYPRSGSGGMGSWSNRVKINIQGQPAWFGCPIDKKSSDGVICDVLIADDPRWKKKAIKTLQMNYAKAENFDVAMPIVSDLLGQETRSLSEFNISSIRKIASMLGIDAQFILQSDLNTTHSSTELLVEICKEADCDTYLVGGGAGGYQEDASFAASGLTLQYQNYEPKPYGKPDAFLPGLSVIDFLFHSTALHVPTKAGAK